MSVHCNSYWPGHDFWGLSAHKTHQAAKRIRVTLQYIGGTEFRVKIFGIESSLSLHHHDPARLAGLIELVPRAFYFVEGSHYLNLILNGGRELISMSETPLTSCSLGRWAPKRPPKWTPIVFPEPEKPNPHISHAETGENNA